MVQVKMTHWGNWKRVHNALWIALAESIEARNDVADDARRRAHQQNIDQLLADVAIHSRNGKRLIDLNSADQQLAQEIATAAAKARREADRLKGITASTSRLTGFVEQLTRLVAQFTLI